MFLFIDSEFDPNNQILLDCINSNSNVDNVTKLKEELKKLITEVKMRRKEINIIAINEDGLKKNIKHLEDIISIKVIMFKLFIFSFV